MLKWFQYFYLFVRLLVQLLEEFVSWKNIFFCFNFIILIFYIADYINKCNYDENTISQCVLDNVPKVLPHLKDGIKGLHLPPLVPFHLEELTIEPSPGLVLKLKNLEIYGLDKVNMTQLT